VVTRELNKSNKTRSTNHLYNGRTRSGNALLKCGLL